MKMEINPIFRLTWITLIACCCGTLMASPLGIRLPPVAPKEASEKLKQADALLKQGLNPELAYQLAYEVYEKYGHVRAAWYPSWVYRQAKGKLPDPNDRFAVVRAVVEGRVDLPLNLLRWGATSVGLLYRASRALGDYEKIAKWGEMLIQAGDKSYMLLKTVEAARLALAQGMKRYPRQKPLKTTWRPLPLRFREEDYFILVPLDEACKVFGISYRLDISPKTKRVRYVFLGEKGKLLPGLTQARNLKGEREYLAYACFEEEGKIWVPFYWLAEQAGIGEWEVRNGKIYVASK